jgi:hypothetical protein
MVNFGRKGGPGPPANPPLVPMRLWAYVPMRLWVYVPMRLWPFMGRCANEIMGILGMFITVLY